MSQSTILHSVMSGRVYLDWFITKQRIKCLVQGHNTVPPVGLEPSTPRSLIKHSTTGHCASHFWDCRWVKSFGIVNLDFWDVEQFLNSVIVDGA